MTRGKDKNRKQFKPGKTRGTKSKASKARSKIDTGLGSLRKSKNTKSNRTTAKKKLGVSHGRGGAGPAGGVKLREIDFEEIEKLDDEYAEEIVDFVRVRIVLYLLNFWNFFYYRVVID